MCAELERSGLDRLDPGGWFQCPERHIVWPDFDGVREGTSIAHQPAAKCVCNVPRGGALSVRRQQRCVQRDGGGLGGNIKIGEHDCGAVGRESAGPNLIPTRICKGMETIQ
jgi:hypothetical protein